MSIEIRPIRPEDNTQLAIIIRSVLTEFGANRPGTVFTDPTTDNLSELFQTPGSCYWVALQNGVIFGGCGIFPTPNLPEGYAELVKLYLGSESRGLGLGKKLIEKSLESALKMGYTDIYLESMPELSKAVGIYEKLGFSYLDSALGNSGHFGCDIWMHRRL